MFSNKVSRKMTGNFGSFDTPSACCGVVYLDALIVKIKENGRVINKAVYLVIGVNLQGLKEVLGIWIADCRWQAQSFGCQ